MAGASTLTERVRYVNANRTPGEAGAVVSSHASPHASRSATSGSTCRSEALVGRGDLTGTFGAPPVPVEQVQGGIAHVS